MPNPSVRALVLSVLMFFAQPAMAQVDQSFDITDWHLQELETRYFHRTFVKETLGERLDRLENFVTGKLTKSEPTERLANLEKVVSAVKKQDADLCLDLEKPGNAASQAAPPPVAQQIYEDSLLTKTAEPAPSTPPPVPMAPASDRINALEMSLIGHRNEHTDILERLKRLEQAAGMPKSNRQLSMLERLAFLEKATPQKKTPTPPSTPIRVARDPDTSTRVARVPAPPPAAPRTPKAPKSHPFARAVGLTMITMIGITGALAHAMANSNTSAGYYRY